ncbi:Crp/Fnr family transcriptional regulator [Rhizobium aouanii]|uniref:Crp/Fnr family transcriptional regulator n=1 Tax=Rhizobium aouanii TaxID=3118145 RepID=A0ABU8CVG3_9HYPH
MPLDQAKIHNRLLKALPANCFAALSGQLELVDLPLGHVLVEPDALTGSVVFIERGLGSIVASSSDGKTVEVGHLGFEGMSGAHLLLKARRTPNKTFMQTPGSGLALSSDLLERFILQHREASDLLLRYVHSCALQLAHSALANARYNMPERLARWLLMCHDRIRVPDLPITHEFLSLMLGVRRSGVTDQLHIIEGLGIVKATRGNLRILSRAKLEDAAGGCYGIPEREYDRLVGPVQ